MSQEIEPPGGLPFRDAFFKFTDPDKHLAWQEADHAWDRLQWALNPSILETQGTPWEGLLDPPGASKPEPIPKPDKQELRKAERARDVAFTMAWDDFTNPLLSGDVVAFAYPRAEPGCERRSRVAADLWDVFHSKSISWSPGEPVLKGRGQAFHDLRFHRETDLQEWRRGARLPLAFRSIAPSVWARYQADIAPAEYDEKMRQIYGGYERMKLWALLCEALIDSEDYELRVLWPRDPPDTGWRPISVERLEVFSNSASINIEKSKITFPDVGAVPVRLFLRDAVRDRPERFAPVGAEAKSGQPGLGEKAVSSALAEKDCRRWLQAERAAGPPETAKEGYWQTASERFKGLSRRAFDRAWANAVGDDAEWTRAGPKRKVPRT